MTNIELTEALRRLAFELRLATWALIVLAVALMIIGECEDSGAVELGPVDAFDGWARR